MKRLFTLFFAFLFLPFTAVIAQEPFGSIEGTVKDPQGAVVLNATVTVRNIATNASRTVVSNDEGQYRNSSAAAGQLRGESDGDEFQAISN